MEIILELLVQIIFEAALPAITELLFEFGLRSFVEPINIESLESHAKHNPILTAFVYLLFGVAIGALSLLVFPQRIVRNDGFHGINLLITPLVAGLAIARVRWLYQPQGKRFLRLDAFSYGFIFAFGTSLIRFVYAW